jgi:hypothetical protein
MYKKLLNYKRNTLKKGIFLLIISHHNHFIQFMERIVWHTDGFATILDIINLKLDISS